MEFNLRNVYQRSELVFERGSMGVHLVTWESSDPGDRVIGDPREFWLKEIIVTVGGDPVLRYRFHPEDDYEIDQRRSSFLLRRERGEAGITWKEAEQAVWLLRMLSSGSDVILPTALNPAPVTLVQTRFAEEAREFLREIGAEDE